MKKSLILTLAVLAAGALQAGTSDAPFMALKLRTQAGLTTDQGMRNGFGLGINFSPKIGPGTLNAELGFQYYPGKQYRQPIDPNNAFGVALTDATAVDSRKNACAGLALRAAWSQEFTKELSWQAGLSMANLKNHHESVGTFGSVGEYGHWAYAIDKTNLTLSPFGGVKWDFNEIGALEVNLLIQSLKVTTVEPTYNASATGLDRVTPTVGEKTLTKLKLEIGYAFKF